jgi:hypothetical protein
VTIKVISWSTTSRVIYDYTKMNFVFYIGPLVSLEQRVGHVARMGEVRDVRILLKTQHLENSHLEE